MDNSVLCIAQLTAKLGKENELKERLHVLVEATRKEAGCISYTFYKAQDSNNTCVIIEKFKDMEAFNFHSNSDYIIKFKNELDDFIVKNGFIVNLYKPITV